jgi:glycosyltransferase involved in cell wall biosynthesis
VGETLYGAERSLLDVLAAVDRRRFDLTCVLPASNAAYEAAVARHTADIVVFPYTWWHRTRPIDLATVGRFEAVFRDRRADLVHVNTITLRDPLLAARRSGVPTIVHARELIRQDPYLAGHLGEAPDQIVATVLASADYIVANSDTTHAMYRKPGKSFCLYNCIDVERFDLPMAPVPGRLRVGIISSNLPGKGLAAFAELATRAARRTAALEFVAFGPRSEETDRLWPDLPDNVRLAGYVPDPVDAVRQVDVIVSLSDVPESFGRTLAEAMAARRPVVGYATGAAHEVVRHGRDGFLVPHGDIDGVLAHLVSLVDDPRRLRTMGESGRLRVVEQFSPGPFAAKLNEIYRRILT